MGESCEKKVECSEISHDAFLLFRFNLHLRKVGLVDLFMSKRESMWEARLLNGSHALIERCTIVVFIFRRFDFGWDLF